MNPRGKRASDYKGQHQGAKLCRTFEAESHELLGENANALRRVSQQWMAAVVLAAGLLFLLSSPPALADLHPMKLDSHRVVGTEVGLSLVPSSPFLSWTRGPRSTSPCRHGPSSAPEHDL
jgi:hypothetical protein